MDAAKTHKLYNIEFLRFIFSVIIVYYHILHNNLPSKLGESTAYLNALADKCNYAGYVVECFFILAGYFLFQSYIKRPELTVKEFAYKKAVRLWPVLFVSILIAILFFGVDEIPSLFNALFLQCIGVSFDYQGIAWYISPFFWTILFYYVLIRCSKNKKTANIMIGVITYFSYVVLVNNFFGRETIFGILNLGLLRALGGIGVGYLIGLCLKSINELPFVKNFKGNKFQNFLIVLLMTLAELVFSALLIRHFFFADLTYGNQFFVVILFSGLMLCMLSGKGLLSRLFNNKFFGFLGKYSYSIYMMQQIAFWILKETLWENTAFVTQHSLRCIIFSTAFALLLGIAAYYIVEKPSAIVLNRFGKKLFAK